MYREPDLAALTARPGWQAHLHLRFARRGDTTRLIERQHHGPLQVQRPFQTGGGCQVYILHPPGGVVGGDELHIEAQLDPHSRALLTTPAAGKFYRSAGRQALQRQTLTAESHALLEWLPQETILYAGAKLHNHTRIDLHDNACCIAWELTCLGRPAAAETFTHGSAELHLELWRDNIPLLLECQRLEGEQPVMTTAWGMAGQPVCATLIASPVPDGVLAPLQTLITEQPGFSVTQLDGVLVCRYRGASAATARRLFHHVWTLLRPALSTLTACPPRVWFT